MYRMVEEDLIAWKAQPRRKPLLIRGARQVGKSYTIEKFGKAHFEEYVLINFEFTPKFRSCFSTLDPIEIINAIELMAGVDVHPGKTLLILDEIQECPEAILALRYFKEKLPDQHVIAAGSLLEFVLNMEKFRMPVGRVQSLYMKPCTFNEYLIASGNEKLYQYLQDITLDSNLHLGIHEALLTCLREYLFLGGMPEVIATYLETKSVQQSKLQQGIIHDFFRRDFGKYDGKVKPEILRLLYERIPGLVGEKFQYTKVDSTIRAREMKPGLRALKDAGLAYSVYHTSASGLPLKTTMNEKKYKLLFLDVGLMAFEACPDFNALMHEHLILLNRGAIAEQFVGQELLAHQPHYIEPEIYFWEREERSSTAEVDYVISKDVHIIPVEVKSGKTGRLKSLQIFLDEKKLDVGVRVSQKQLSFEKRVLSIPLYMVSQLSRIYHSIL